MHWVSKRQKVKARSLAEAEIYATDEYFRDLLRLQHILDDMDVKRLYILCDSPINIYSDNNTCVCWSKFTKTKGLQHVTIWENATRESMQNKIVSIHHIAGDVNLANIFKNR